MAEQRRLSGIIRKICGDGHYSFIEAGDERDFYFHHSRVRSGIPQEGAEVRFTVQPDHRGPRAIDVEVL